MFHPGGRNSEFMSTADNLQVLGSTPVQGGLEGKGAALLGQPRKEWAEQDSNLRLLPCKRIQGFSMEYPGDHLVISSP
jgi:hypothetical protein